MVTERLRRGKSEQRYIVPNGNTTLDCKRLTMKQRIDNLMILYMYKEHFLCHFILYFHLLHVEIIWMHLILENISQFYPFTFPLIMGPFEEFKLHL